MGNERKTKTPCSSRDEGRVSKKARSGQVNENILQPNAFTDYFNKGIENAPGGSESSIISQQHTSYGNGYKEPLDTPSNSSQAVTPSSNQIKSDVGSADAVYSRRDGNALANKAGSSLYAQPRKSLMFEEGSGVDVDLRVNDGEYVLKISRRSVPCSTDEFKENSTKEMAQQAGMLLSQAEMLRDLGEKLLAPYRTALQSMFLKS